MLEENTAWLAKCEQSDTSTNQTSTSHKHLLEHSLGNDLQYPKQKNLFGTTFSNNLQTYTFGYENSNREINT